MSELTTEGPRHQIDTYDFFAYLIPGALTCGSLLLPTFQLFHLTIDKATSFLSKLPLSTFTSASVIFLVVSYLIGHVIATVAVLIYDRIFVEKIFGYPSVTLFDEGASKEISNRFSADFYRVVLSILVLLAYFETAPWITQFSIWLFEGVAIRFLVALLLMRWLLSSIRHLDRTLTEEHPWTSKISKETTKGLGRIFHIFATPFKVVESAICHFFGLNKPFQSPMREKILEEFQKTFNMKVDNNSELYWCVYWYVTECSVHIRQRLYKFLSLYGMTRNVSMALILSSVIVAYYSIPGALGPYSKSMAFITMICGLLLSIRYYYLYLNYFNKSLFRTFLVARIRMAEMNTTRGVG